MLSGRAMVLDGSAVVLNLGKRGKLLPWVGL